MSYLALFYSFEWVEYFYFLNAGIDFRRQDLTSTRQILTSKVDPRIEKIKIFDPSRSDVCRRQILTYKVGPRAERVWFETF